MYPVGIEFLKELSEVHARPIREVPRRLVESRIVGTEVSADQIAECLDVPTPELHVRTPPRRGETVLVHADPPAHQSIWPRRAQSPPSASPNPETTLGLVPLLRYQPQWSRFVQ